MDENKSKMNSSSCSSRVNKPSISSLSKF